MSGGDHQDPRGGASQDHRGTCISFIGIPPTAARHRHGQSPPRPSRQSPHPADLGGARGVTSGCQDFRHALCFGPSYAWNWRCKHELMSPRLVRIRSLPVFQLTPVQAPNCKMGCCSTAAMSSGLSLNWRGLGPGVFTRLQPRPPPTSFRPPQLLTASDLLPPPTTFRPIPANFQQPPPKATGQKRCQFRSSGLHFEGKRD